MAGDHDHVGRLKAIRDPGMRSAKMVELLGGDPELSVIFLHRLLRDSGGPRDPQAVVLDAMVVALGEGRLSYATRSLIYEAAIARADGLVARLFLEGARERRDTAGLEEALPEARPITPQSRPLSLGERKSLARGRRDERLLGLLREPHPDVIAILLGNPHLIEADVLVVASRRPTLAQTQQLIMASHRWRARYRIKRALVLNPYSPPSIGIRLTCGLNDLDLRDVKNDPNLSPLVRQQAAGLLELRRRR